MPTLVPPRTSITTGLVSSYCCVLVSFVFFQPTSLEENQPSTYYGNSYSDSLSPGISWFIRSVELAASMIVVTVRQTKNSHCNPYAWHWVGVLVNNDNVMMDNHYTY